jgi:putative ABC transport system permease protein
VLSAELIREQVEAVAPVCPLALLAARALGTQLYGVQSFDPLSLGAALLVPGVAGLVASWLPARRATRVDPLTALR